jgi:hypothetical protein
MNEATTAPERINVLRAHMDDIGHLIAVVKEDAESMPLTIRIEVNNLEEVLDLLRVKLYQLENP